jgi:Mat/Ecp fimbriae major subunit
MYSKSAFHSLCLGLIMSAAFAVHGSAEAANASGSARGQIRKPVTITSTSDLNFGNVIRGATAGTVTINARTGARTRTGGTVLQGTVFSRAAFTGTASGGRLVRYTLGAPSVTLNGPGGATMTVNTFRISINGAGQQTLPRNATMPAAGSSSLNIGARLNVAANQADGDYTGSFALTMDYQ